MTIYEAIGMAWVVFTSTLATIEIIYLAFVGAKQVTGQATHIHVNQDISQETLERIIRVKD